MASKPPAPAIVGHYFLDNTFGEQGQVIAHVEGPWFLVVMFSWLTGEETHRKVLSMKDLACCVLFENLEQLSKAVEKREKAEERNKKTGI
jgi:hypothetical protein